MFTDGVKAGTGGWGGRGNERDVKHDDDDAGTAEDSEAKHERIKAAHRSPKAEVRECNVA